MTVKTCFRCALCISVLCHISHKHMLSNLIIQSNQSSTCMILPKRNKYEQVLGEPPNNQHSQHNYIPNPKKSNQQPLPSLRHLGSDEGRCSSPEWTWWCVPHASRFHLAQWSHMCRLICHVVVDLNSFHLESASSRKKRLLSRTPCLTFANFREVWSYIFRRSSGTWVYIVVKGRLWFPSELVVWKDHSKQTNKGPFTYK